MLDVNCPPSPLPSSYIVSKTMLCLQRKSVSSTLYIAHKVSYTHCVASKSVFYARSLCFARSRAGALARTSGARPLRPWSPRWRPSSRPPTTRCARTFQRALVSLVRGAVKPCSLNETRIEKTQLVESEGGKGPKIARTKLGCAGFFTGAFF